MSLLCNQFSLGHLESDIKICASFINELHDRKIGYRNRISVSRSVTSKVSQGNVLRYFLILSYSEYAGVVEVLVYPRIRIMRGVYFCLAFAALIAWRNLDLTGRGGRFEGMLKLSSSMARLVPLPWSTVFSGQGRNIGARGKLYKRIPEDNQLGKRRRYEVMRETLGHQGYMGS